MHGVVVKEGIKTESEYNIIGDPQLTRFIKYNSDIKLNKQPSYHAVNKKAQSMFSTNDLLENKSQNFKLLERSNSNASFGITPGSFLPHLKRKQSLPSLKSVKPIIIVNKEELTKNMKLPEETTKNLKRNNKSNIVRTAHKSTGRNRRGLINAKSRMPQPPIGKSVGHGLFNP